MIPFHLFLFSLFVSKEKIEISGEQYRHDLLVKQLHEKSRENLFKMNLYM
jgi:hypothetical protein